MGSLGFQFEGRGLPGALPDQFDTGRGVEGSAVTRQHVVAAVGCTPCAEKRDYPMDVRLIDSTLVIVLHNGEQEIEREVASPADAVRVALMMLARRGRLEIGDVLKVLAPN